MKVSEKCSCGATFEFSCWLAVNGNAAAYDWRRAHVCTDRPPRTGEWSTRTARPRQPPPSGPLANEATA